MFVQQQLGRTYAYEDIVLIHTSYVYLHVHSEFYFSCQEVLFFSQNRIKAGPLLRIVNTVRSNHSGDWAVRSHVMATTVTCLHNCT